MPRLGQGQASSPLFELARVLVRLDDIAGFVVTRIIELLVSSPDESPMQRSQEDAFSSFFD